MRRRKTQPAARKRAGRDMHELGVVFYVVKDVKQVAEENGVEKVATVTLQIGEV